MDGLKTGELARRAGVNVETLRFYERKGLLPVPPRRPSGYREYPPGDVRRIRFIRRAQDLGFSLGEIRELLAIRVRRGATAAEIRSRAGEKLEDVRRKIADLGKIEQVPGGARGSVPGSRADRRLPDRGGPRRVASLVGGPGRAPHCDMTRSQGGCRSWVSRGEGPRETAGRPLGLPRGLSGSPPSPPAPSPRCGVRSGGRRSPRPRGRIRRPPPASRRGRSPSRSRACPAARVPRGSRRRSRPSMGWPRPR